MSHLIIKLSQVELKFESMTMKYALKSVIHGNIYVKMNTWTTLQLCTYLRKSLTESWKTNNGKLIVMLILEINHAYSFVEMKKKTRDRCGLSA